MPHAWRMYSVKWDHCLRDLRPTSERYAGIRFCRGFRRQGKCRLKKDRKMHGWMLGLRPLDDARMWSRQRYGCFRWADEGPDEDDCFRRAKT